MEKNFETLQVGAEYRNRLGQKVDIKEHNTDWHHPFRDSNDKYYMPDGSYLQEGAPNLFDLVELLTLPEAAKERYPRDSNGWIDATKHLPENLPDHYYSANVLALVRDYNGILLRLVMCNGWADGDEGESGYVWANCNTIDGDAEYDDEYDVIAWQPLPPAELGILSKTTTT